MYVGWRSVDGFYCWGTEVEERSIAALEMERGVESIQLWVVLGVAEDDAPQVQVNRIRSWVGDGF